MGNTFFSKNTRSIQQYESPIHLKLEVLYNYGEMNITVDPLLTVSKIKTQFDRYRQHSFEYSTHIWQQDNYNKWIVNCEVVHDNVYICDLVKQNTTRDLPLNIIMLVNMGCNWMRYKCINCGYVGSVPSFNGFKSHMLSCLKCEYRIPFPQRIIPQSYEETLQQSLQQIPCILPTILREFNRLNIPRNIMHCVMSYFVGDIIGISDHGVIKFCNQNTYHYSLICNPFKPYLYEWIPTVVESYNCNNHEIVISNPEIGTIKTNNFHSYDASESLHANSSLDANKRTAIIESDKECKIFIAREQIYFDKDIYCNKEEEKQDKKGVQFEIKTLTGKTIAPCMELHETVTALKQFVLDHEGIPHEQQRFVSPYGRDMEDHKTLRYYGISTGSPVYLVLRLRG